MAHCISVLGFETMEHRVVLSAGVGAMDFDSLPDMEPDNVQMFQDQDLVQKVQPLNGTDRDHTDGINLLSVSSSIPQQASETLPVLMVIADQQDFYYQEYGDTR